MKPRPYPFLTFSFIFILLLAAVLSPELRAQDSQDAASQAESDTIVVLPIPPTEITTEYDESSQLISDAGKLQLSEGELKELGNERDTIFAIVKEFLADSILLSLGDANIRELDNARGLVDIHINQISAFQTKLNKRSREIQEASIELAQSEKRWSLTGEKADETGIPDVLQLRIDKILHQIDSVSELLQEDFTIILVEEDVLSDRNTQLKALQDSILERKQTIGESLFSKDMPPFFEDLSSMEDSQMLDNHMKQLVDLFHSDLRLISTKYKVQLLFMAIILVFILIYAFWFKRRYTVLIPADQFNLTNVHLALIESPVASSLFITTLMIRFVFHEFVLSLQVINLFILMVPMIIILLRRYSEHASPWIEILIGFYVLTFFYEVSFHPDILQRIALMFLSISGFVYFLLLLIRRNLILKTDFRFLTNLIRFLFGLFALLCFIAIFGNLSGAFRMAEYFTLAFMQITILVLVIFVATRVVDALVFILLAGRPMQRLNVVREDFSIIHKKTKRLINLFLWIYLFIGVLDLLNMKEKFMEWGSNTLNSGWKLGAVEITPASILIFIFVIWLSIVISRIITTVLEKDVFSRVTISKGMPHTVSMLLKIVLITGGFFLAAAAAGMELSNISIVLGAFSVGIGFGLQNIFNNMVSGLILAFERPIKVGDTVQVGDLVGVVLSIGFRASTVKSYDGAEVIVPNGNLISNSMVNWTLSDYLRRMDLRVGVAYGTDPKVVLEILKGVAEGHDKVRKKPGPSAFFIGFGDSSLDFRLLAWTDIDSRLTVESELNVSINNKLDEAGIEIPFPQRDLHVRSDDTKG